MGDASVSVATDRCIYQSEVFVASTPAPTVARKVGAMQGKDGEREREKGWGGHAVLVLVGIRLSLDRANPVYYDTIKVRLSPPGGVFKFIHICARIHTLYTLPQSVGIAGGRPSLSYYFVGSQVDDLFTSCASSCPAHASFSSAAGDSGSISWGTADDAGAD